MTQCDKGVGMKLVLGIRNGRLTRCLAGLVAIAVSTMLVSACSSSSGSSDPQNTAEVALSPASGSNLGTPTWATTVPCPKGFQGSAVFRVVTPAGTTFSISGATNTVTAPFHGTLLGSIAEIEEVSNVPKDYKQKYVIVCFSGPSLTGTSHQEMSMYVSYTPTHYAAAG
jgi:hypothetical protein